MRYFITKVRLKMSKILKTNLRKLHNGGDKNAGINVRKVRN